ncbi:Putative 2-hydroxyacid dehydrogenase (plasmid) [Aminobacter sp. MSH1]|uniref:NAD(P)-dependent oxidoreductase n=1 Tax=Aminobacter sp. MSH1 TaxID=374606 RepID=UPI000D505D57|nr:NAD(P)-dependent oxidoreductase [Aminobacter sp. MSH1]AWC26017.1 Putative 2-hydroxyacid dehydrogenase [Aminobacter sp. MSH1]
MSNLKVLFATFRAPRHQKIAMEAAPEGLDITMCEAPSRAELLEQLPLADVFISERSGLIDADMLAAGRRLRLVQRLGRMTHDIDADAARKAGIPVCRWPLRGCSMVAEHAMMQVLSLVKASREAEHALVATPDWGTPPKKCDENHFAYNWTERRKIRSLAGATVGILGFGEIGAELAVRLRAFDCEVLYNKRSRLPAAVEAEFGVEYADIDSIRARSDVLCILLPHGEGIGEMIDHAFIEQMKPGAYLVSTGASTVLNEADVAAAYRVGILSGVATDGWTWEPVPRDNPLLRLADDPQANVVFTPHIAGGVRSNDRSMRELEWENIRRLMDGRELRHRVA